MIWLYQVPIWRHSRLYKVIVWKVDSTNFNVSTMWKFNISFIFTSILLIIQYFWAGDVITTFYFLQRNIPFPLAWYGFELFRAKIVGTNKKFVMSSPLVLDGSKMAKAWLEYWLKKKLLRCLNHYLLLKRIKRNVACLERAETSVIAYSFWNICMLEMYHNP